LNKTQKGINELIDQTNASTTELTEYFNNNTHVPYFDADVRDKATQPEQTKHIFNTYILNATDQIPAQATTVDAIADFLVQDVIFKKYFENGKLQKAIDRKYFELQDKASKVFSSMKTEGIIDPSGRQRLLIDGSWQIQDTYIDTPFMLALKKDGKRLTAYSRASGEEAFAESFALFMTQPETTQATSPNLYNYFNNKTYKNHDPCPSLSDF